MKEMICTECLRGTVRNGVCPVCGAKVDPQRPAEALPLASRLQSGRYLIGRVLGCGGYGITYTAWDMVERKQIALKESFPSFACVRGPDGMRVCGKDPKGQRDADHTRFRFIQESILLKSLEKTPEILHIGTCFEENNTAYYTMELLHGMDMRKYLKTYGALRWNRMEGIARQLLRALYSLHCVGYIHRDISPDNIFMLRDGSIRLIDFGNARRYSTDKTMTVVVKDKFAPAEQYQPHGNQGPWTDIYALCVTLYYAMTSYLPEKAVGGAPKRDLPPLRELQPEVPEAFSRAIARGMSPREQERFPGIPELAFAMFPGESVLRGIRPQTPPVMPREEPQNRRQTGFPEYPQTHTSAPERKTGMLYLECTHGTFQGRRTPLTVGKILSIGRGEDKGIAYPDKAPGISRNQCSVLLHSKHGTLVRDDGSTYGTRVNGRQLDPMKWVDLWEGDSLTFAAEVYHVVRG